MERSAYWLRYHYTIHGLIDGSSDRLKITMQRRTVRPVTIEEIHVALPPERYHRLTDMLAKQIDTRFHGENAAHTYHTRALEQYIHDYIVPSFAKRT